MPSVMRDPIAEHGVVGAGGAGFPTAVKFRTRAKTLIVNAAECEPLLHKDKELMIHHWPEIRQGIEMAMQRIGATEGVIGIKAKHEELIRRLKKQLPPDVRLCSLRDSYPSGDEFILVYDVTGRVIPPGGLPIHLGVVVSNVETLYNVGVNRPVTRKFLTVAGSVQRPISLSVPIGTPFAAVIQEAGGSVVPDFRVLVGGAMMGRLAASPDEPVTKTTGGLIVLPSDHSLARRYALSWRQVERKAVSACDQCCFCTELCPRYLLGHPIEPHKAMRHIGFGGVEPRPVGEGLYCCECNLCSLYSCPEDLDPKEVCVFNKAKMKRESRDSKTDEVLRAHPLINARRVPTKRLAYKLGLTGYQDDAPLVESGLKPSRLTIPLRQHIGVSCVPRVKAGQRIREEELIAAPPDGALGANIHAPADGVIREITDLHIAIEA